MIKKSKIDISEKATKSCFFPIHGSPLSPNYLGNYNNKKKKYIVSTPRRKSSQLIQVNKLRACKSKDPADSFPRLSCNSVGNENSRYKDNLNPWNDISNVEMDILTILSATM